MSEAVQITLIICITIIVLYIISFFDSSNEESSCKERFGYCKSPTYPRPPRPGSGTKDNSRLEKFNRNIIGHNPSPPGGFEKPGFPGRKEEN